MTDTVNHKIKALELANQFTGEKPGEIVARATAYHAFLAGTTAPAGGAAGATAGAKNPAGAATGGASNKAATPPKADAAKGAAGAAGAKPDADKAAATAAAKAAAAKANTAKTPAAGGATGAPVPPDTKAPGGKNTYADVVNALRQVKEKSSKEDAVAILVEDGGGAKSVRDLKPALYDAVVEACENVINGDGGAAGGEAGAVEDPTAQPERDELGL